MGFLIQSWFCAFSSSHTIWIFFRACFCIVGRCDHRDDHTDVARSTDDYLWIKLSQLLPDDADSSASSSSTERQTLPQLQSLLLEEYGKG